VPGEAVFVLSDLHFNAIGPDRQAGLVRFLLEVVRRRGARLYLNGDILDYVRGDRPPAEAAFRLFQRSVDAVRAEGIPVTYVIGNHDLPLVTLLRPASPEAVEDVYADREPAELAPGLTLCYRKATLEYAGRRVHVEHGHVYDPGWLMTPAQERSLHVPGQPPPPGADWMDVVLGLFAARPAFGEDYRGRRARTGSDIPPFEMARYAVRRLEREDAADWYVLGHFHAPTLESLEGRRRYLNTGDSVANGGYGVLTEGQIRLGDWREALAAR
jgi:UDP-2,3-diacylglucosamine pyrophosphatase LpxH